MLSNHAFITPPAGIAGAIQEPTPPSLSISRRWCKSCGGRIEHNPKIPQSIIINMPPSGGGRRAGSGNYTDPELRHMFAVLKDVLPIGPEEWRQVADRHAEKYPGRDVDSIRRKYASNHRKQVPTGDPTCPWYVKEAKKIKRMIGQKAELGDPEDDVFDLESGEFNNNNNNNNTIVAEDAEDAPPLGQPSQLTIDDDPVGEDDEDEDTPAPPAAPPAVLTPATTSTSVSGLATRSSSRSSSASTTPTPKRHYRRVPDHQQEVLDVLKNSVELQKEALVDAKDHWQMILETIQACIAGAVEFSRNIMTANNPSASTHPAATHVAHVAAASSSVAGTTTTTSSVSKKRKRDDRAPDSSDSSSSDSDNSY